MPEYTLPDLPYDYAALEPHYSAQILELHHDKHHATYVKGANTALEKLAAARENEEFGTINQLQKNLAFNLSGHVLHSLFWTNMSPHGGDKPARSSRNSSTGSSKPLRRGAPTDANR